MGKPASKKGLSMTRGDRRSLRITATPGLAWCAEEALAAFWPTQGAGDFLEMLTEYHDR
jgi:hypothetical protein